MSKKVLVTAGNTNVPIDRVRSMTNIFKGRTGVAIAQHFAKQGCRVTLLASNPKLVTQNPDNPLEVIRFNTYDDLFRLMEIQVRNENFDVIIQSAAVSDYRIAGVYQQMGPNIEKIDRFTVDLEKLDQSGKISSKYPKLWIETAPTVKIVDQIRAPWGFKGLLVKFKLQVNMNDGTLVELAKKSMYESQADMIVANTLDTFDRAIVICKNDPPRHISRSEIPNAIYEGLKI